MTEAAAKPAKRSVWKSFSQPAAWTMFYFGFSSGLPFLLVAGTLAYWLRESGMELKNITVIASAGMTYALKFLWAPFLDHSRAPVFGRMGLRRGWLMLAQVGVLLGLIGMAVTSPAQLGVFIVFTLLVAFFGATQDIAVDAYRIEIAPVADQGALVAVYSLGYRVALILSGAFALGFADHMPWWQVYLIMAVAMLIPIGANLRAIEPEGQRRTGGTWGETMRAMFVDSFADFFRRYGVALSLWVLLFILLFKIPEQALVGGIMSPFYLDMGFTKTTIGVVTKLYGVWVGILGVFVGGILVARYNARKSLLFAMVITALCNLLYLLLIAHPGNVLVLTAVISGENFMLGVLGTTAVAFLSSLVNREHTATQYALLSSMVNLPGKILGVFAGLIVQQTSYAYFFVIATLAVLPATLLFLWLMPRLKVAVPEE